MVKTGVRHPDESCGGRLRPHGVAGQGEPWGRRPASGDLESVLLKAGWASGASVPRSAGEYRDGVSCPGEAEPCAGGLREKSSSSRETSLSLTPELQSPRASAGECDGVGEEQAEQARCARNTLSRNSPSASVIAFSAFSAPSTPLWRAGIRSLPARHSAPAWKGQDSRVIRQSESTPTHSGLRTTSWAERKQRGRSCPRAHTALDIAQLEIVSKRIREFAPSLAMIPRPLTPGREGDAHESLSEEERKRIVGNAERFTADTFSHFQSVPVFPQYQRDLRLFMHSDRLSGAESAHNSSHGKEMRRSTLVSHDSSLEQPDVSLCLTEL